MHTTCSILSNQSFKFNVLLVPMIILQQIFSSLLTTWSLDILWLLKCYYLMILYECKPIRNKLKLVLICAFSRWLRNVTMRFYFSNQRPTLYDEYLRFIYLFVIIVNRIFLTFSWYVKILILCYSIPEVRRNFPRQYVFLNVNVCLTDIIFVNRMDL